MFLASSGVSISEIGVIGSLVFALAGAAATYVTYRLRRRSQGGDVQKTSDAGVLWTQSQAMLAQLGAEKMKAEEQRDRLIEMQTTQVLPAMTAMNSSLKEISDELARLDRIISHLDAQYGARRKVPLRELQGGRDGQGLRQADPRSCAAGRREDGDHQRNGRLDLRDHRRT